MQLLPTPLAGRVTVPYGQHVAVRRALRTGWLTADRVVLAAAALIVMVAAALDDQPPATADARDLDVLAVGFLLFGAVLLTASGRFPATVALGTLGVVFVWYGAGYTSSLVNVLPLVAFFRLGAGDGQRRKIGVAAAAAVATLAMMTGVGEEPWGDAVGAVGYLVVATLFGEFVRNRRLVVEEYAERARHAEAEVEQRVTQERMRIARDLHDVLAHTVSGMTVQAGVAMDALDRDPGAARDALTAVRETSREALDEVRATLAVLRSGEDREGLAPAPRIDRVPVLVDAARGRGLDVDVDVALSDDPLPDVVELTAFRVVQEGLTNVVRHARASRVWVTIRQEPSSLLVEVRDDGTSDDPIGPPGMGLRGMAERVHSLGGELLHGRPTNGRRFPGADHGWTVRALIPLRARPT